MNSHPSISLFAGRLLMPAIVVLAMLPDLCQADCGCGWHCTWNAWSRTWHTPSSLDTPLRPYYIPRTSWMSECDGCAGGCGEAIEYGSLEYPMWEDELPCEQSECKPAACAATPHCGFERLGRIPNDFDLGAGAPAASSTAAGR